MANPNQFEPQLSSGAPNSPACAVCEAMLPEALDGSLSEAQQRAFDTHLGTCVVCSQELAEAQRGAAWLTLLKQRAPEPPTDLLAKILAQTSGQNADPVAALAPKVRTVPVWQQRWNRLSTWVTAETERLNLQSLLQPRLAMTAAMAFFSIALTLNISGVHLQNVRASDFGPAGLRRSVAEAGASLTRTVQNNRSVYQMESRLSELRSDDGPGDHSAR